jgi:hypothetical protein
MRIDLDSIPARSGDGYGTGDGYGDGDLWGPGTGNGSGFGLHQNGYFGDGIGDGCFGYRAGTGGGVCRDIAEIYHAD